VGAHAGIEGDRVARGVGVVAPEPVSTVMWFSPLAAVGFSPRAVTGSPRAWPGGSPAFRLVVG
jgi:hypothetical protein